MLFRSLTASPAVVSGTSLSAGVDPNGKLINEATYSGLAGEEKVVKIANYDNYGTEIL